MTARLSRLALPVMLALLGAGCARTFAAGAAVVNGVRISTERLEAEVREAQQGQLGGQGDAAELARDVLTQLIGQELVRQEAERRKIVIDQRLVGERFDQIRSQFPSEQDFQQALTSRGFTEASLREQIGKQIEQERLAEALGGPVTDEQVRAVYDGEPENFQSRRARHILVEVADQSKDAKARTEAKRLVARIKGGEDMAALAKRHSDDPASKEKGGDLGFVSRDAQLVPEFLDAVFSAKPNTVVGPVRSQFGYHVIRVEKVRVQPFGEVAGQIRGQLQQQLTQRTIGDLLQREAARATVLVNPRYGDWDPQQAAVVPHQSFVPAPPEVDPNARREPVAPQGVLPGQGPPGGAPPQAPPEQ